MVENPRRHIEEINISIQDLAQFQNKTKDPNPIQYQYIGTVLDSTIPQLCMAANSLDGGNRNVQYSEFRNWISFMQVIHRSFYSMLHIAIEMGVCDIYERQKLSATPSAAKKNLQIIEKIVTDSQEEIDKLKRYFNSYKPSFEDKLNAVLNLSAMDKSRKMIWRNYMRALTKVRNKMSHSEQSLSESDIRALKDGRFDVMISDSGILHTNPRHYAQVALHAINFFDELLNSINTQ